MPWSIEPQEKQSHPQHHNTHNPEAEVPLTKKNSKVCFTFANTHLDELQDFWENVLLADEPKSWTFWKVYIVLYLVWN